MPMERVDQPGESQEATEGKKMPGDLRVVCGFGVGSEHPPSKVPFKGLEGVLEGRGELEAPFKYPASPCPLSSPLSSPLQAPFMPPSRAPSSSLQPLQAPFKPSSPFVPLQFKPPLSFLHLEAPLEVPWQTKGL